MKINTWLRAVAIVVAVQAVAAAGADQPPQLHTEFAFEARVKVDKPMVIG